MIDTKTILLNKNRLVYQNEKNMDNLSDSLFEDVARIMRDQATRTGRHKKQIRVLSLFYVDPLDPKTGAWDLLIILAIYLFQIQISLTLGFGPTFWEDQFTSKFYTIAYITLAVLFIVDVIINFHKGYYAFGRGKVIDDHILIIKHYLKIYFAMDVVGNFWPTQQSGACSYHCSVVISCSTICKWCLQYCCT